MKLPREDSLERQAIVEKEGLDREPEEQEALEEHYVTAA
jgi:hypothetical protein